MEEKVGKVTHYFSKLGVAAIEIQHGTLHKGDHIHIVGHTTDVEQVVESMEVEHQQVVEAREGQSIGITVNEHVREHDDVFKAYN